MVDDDKKKKQKISSGDTKQKKKQTSKTIVFVSYAVHQIVRCVYVLRIENCEVFVYRELKL